MLGVISWQRAATLLVQGKARPPYADVDEHKIRTATGVFSLPSVLVLIQYVKVPYRQSAVTRANILKRDGYQCQYCGRQLSNTSGTVDHVLPTSRGGKHRWKNVAAACVSCNGKKDNKTPEEAGMKLLRKPFVPDRHFLLIQAMDLETHRTWKRWIEV
ncbi:MAG: HNH endonuclease [Planctomycetes bacterium]|nr:HNH endonuclease [Planctomycetota bacterium]